MADKMLKIKVGEVYIDGKSYPVFQTAWQKTSKDGQTTYYEIRNPIFIQEIEKQKDFKTAKEIEKEQQQ